MGFISGQEFNESPDGIITEFTTVDPFIGNIIVTQGGLVVYAFNYTDDQTIEFTEAPIAADGDLRWAGYTTSTPTAGTLASFLAGIMERIKDEESKLSTDTLTNNINQALEEYNQRKPNTIVEDLTGDGTSFLAVPSSWEDGFSRVVRLDELNSSNEPSLIHPSRYQVIQNPAPEEPTIYWFYNTFGNGTTYRVLYTVKHTITALASSVPSGDEAALMDLAASHACLRLAAAYAQNIEQSIGTEVINFKDKYDKYKALAPVLRKQYDQHVKHQGASGQKAWKREQTLLFHD